MSRSLTFTIEGLVDTQVTVVENIDGTLTFTVEVDETSQQADLRGLFFDFADETFLGNLSVIGADVTDSQFKADKVKDLGNGANMNGQHTKKGNGFDAGVEFGTPGKGKDDIDTSSFTLGAIDGTPLTLDLLSEMRFGVRLTSVGPEGDREDSLKLVGTAPAVPVANDDDAVFVEAGDTVVVDVLANDTDADGTLDPSTLAFSGADVGTASNVAGQLSYSADDDSVEDFDESTADTLTYTVDDNDGITSNTASIVVNVIDPEEESDVDSSDSSNGQLLTVAMSTEDRTFNDSSFVNIDIDVGGLDQPDINVSFVIDESGSISAAEFGQEQQAVQNTIDLLRAEFDGTGTDVEIQIVQFATGASSATYDLFDTTLDNVTTGTPISSQSRGVTNYEAALQESVNFFTGQGVGDENFMLFTSDGVPYGPQGPFTDEVTALDGLGVNSTAVGFGGADVATLNLIDSNNDAQVLENAGDLGDVFAASPLFPADVFEFNLTVNGIDQGVGVGDLFDEGGGDYSYAGSLTGLDNSLGGMNTVVATVGFDTDDDGEADEFRMVTTQIDGTDGSDITFGFA